MIPLQWLFLLYSIMSSSCMYTHIPSLSLLPLTRSSQSARLGPWVIQRSLSCVFYVWWCIYFSASTILSFLSDSTGLVSVRTSIPAHCKRSLNIYFFYFLYICVNMQHLFFCPTCHFTLISFNRLNFVPFDGSDISFGCVYIYTCTHIYIYV